VYVVYCNKTQFATDVLDARVLKFGLNIYKHITLKRPLLTNLLSMVRCVLLSGVYTIIHARRTCTSCMCDIPVRCTCTTYMCDSVNIHRTCTAYYRTDYTTLGPSNVFTALHEMQTRSSDENSVRLSVCLSDAFVTKWKKDRSRFLYHTKEHLS